MNTRLAAADALHDSCEGLILSGPNTGRLLRPFALRASDGSTAQLADFKQRSNLVLILHHSQPCAACLAFLRTIGENVGAYATAEGVVLGISTDSPEALREMASEVRVPFRLLSDSAGQVAAREAITVPAVLIADRFGEVWAAWLAGDDHAFPSANDIAGWLEFIELQCRECEAPEWPPEQFSAERGVAEA